MSPFKNSSLLTCLLLSKNDSAPTVIQEASKQNTSGNPLLSGITNSDTVMADAVKKLQLTYTGFKQKPPIFTEAQVTSVKIIVIKMYNENALDIQKVARQQVISTGDVNNGINLIDNSGYSYKKPKSATSKLFKVDNDGPGAVSVTTKSAGIGATYIRCFGPTTAKRVIPVTLAEWLVNHEAAITVSGLKSNTIYAFREAIVLPVPRKPKTSSTTSTERFATPTVADKAHKVIFNANDETHYVWSDWIYITVT